MVENKKILTAKQAILQIGNQITHGGFNLDDGRAEYYEKAYNIFVGNEERCEALGVNARKGILIVGKKGVGKSILMRVMHRLFKDTPRRFLYTNSLEIKDMMEEFTVSEIKKHLGKDLMSDLYIDDIGLGQIDVQRYGNITNIVAELLWERDELFVSEGFKTHLSSNIPPYTPKNLEGLEKKNYKSIENLLGDRVIDRIKQMTNLFVWEGDSLRK